MHSVPQARFDIYALALPYGLGFGGNPPIECWESEDQIACGIVTRSDDNGSFGAQVMRRREDDVWTVTFCRQGLADRATAYALVEPALREGSPREPLPPGVQRRPSLSNVSGVEPSNIFKLLAQRTHHVAAWLLNQVYLAMPKPDANWVRDCQTQNFHARLWEALLVACFREQGLSISQDVYRLRHRAGRTRAHPGSDRARFQLRGVPPSLWRGNDSPGIDRNCAAPRRGCNHCTDAYVTRENPYSARTIPCYDRFNSLFFFMPRKAIVAGTRL